MTSIPVTDIGLNIPYMNEAGGSQKVDGTDFMGSLKSALENQSGSFSSKTDVTSVSGASKDAQTEKTKSVNETAEKNPVSKDNGKKADNTDKTETKTNNDKPQSKEVSSEDAEKVVEETKQIIKKVAETMDVSEEEVLTALENLGFAIVDIFEPANMTDLVAELSGSIDAMSLVTDENLYQTLGTLQDFVAKTNDSLMEELDLSQEALAEVLNQTEALVEQSTTEVDPFEFIMQGGELTQTDETNVSEPLLDEKADNTPELVGAKDYKVTTYKDGVAVTTSVKVDDTTGEQTAVVSEVGASDSENEDSSNKGMMGEEKQKSDSTASASVFTQNLQINNENTLIFEDAGPAEAVPTNTQNAVEIAEQIMDSMKANFKPEVTELEMNLHPASLGNVRVNLTAANGQVTAQFIAQNETVRSAIESQVVSLTQQLESQGVKIEAVEVTLASHQFESNTPNGGASGEQANHNSQNSKNTRTRRIDLSAYTDGDDIELLDESDKLTADMMARNGNTVDYTA